MSYHVFFAFSSGLKNPLQVPKGTKQEILAHIEHVQSTLNLEITKYENNPAHWNHWKMGYEGIDDEVVCETVSKHNQWVRRIYWKIAEWAKKPVEDGETISLEDAQEFWHGLEILSVDPSRWTPDYYRERMETLYEVMRGRETEGISFGVKALTEKQAAAVINIFSEYLDKGDLRLDVPHGRDYLASSCDGGYDWCDKCYRPMVWDDAQYCRRRKCPLIEEG